MMLATRAWPTSCGRAIPQVAISRNLAQLLKAYQQEFGLTPSARTRIEVQEPEEEESELMKLRREAIERNARRTNRYS